MQGNVNGNKNPNVNPDPTLIPVVGLEVLKGREGKM